jgi:hypothetical protein
MKKTHTTFIILFIVSFNLYSQNYKTNYITQNLSDSLLYIEKDTNSFINKIKTLPEQDRFFSQELKLARTFLQIGDTTNSLQHYLYAFKKGGGIEHIDLNLNPNHKQYLNENYKKQHLLYLTNHNVSNDFLYRTYELLGNDQLIRVQYMDSVIDQREFSKTDSLNLLTLMELINSYGFPMQKDYGAQFHTFYILMIHLPYLDKKVYQQFVSFYKKNLLNGAITPDLLSYFIDRYDYTETGEQTYGSIADAYFGIPKIKSNKYIDQKRAELYLPSMKIWLALRGIK